MARITFLRIALVLSIVALVLIVIAVATRGWQKDGEYYEQGLWSYCGFSRQIGNKLCGDYGRVSTFLEATRAFALIGLISLAVTVLLLLLRMFVASMAGSRIVTILILVFSWIAVLGLFLACVIYGAKVKHHLHYSYGMACCSLIIQFIAALLLSIVFVKVQD